MMKHIEFDLPIYQNHQINNSNMSEQVSAIDVWNYRLLKAISDELHIRMTRNGMIPIKLIHGKVNRSLEFLENYEQSKQQTIIDRLVKNATLIDKEIAELKSPKWWEIWKQRDYREKVIILTTVRHAYTDTVEIIMTTLPDGVNVDELTQAPAEPPEQEPTKTIPISRNGSPGVESSQ
jgi:hypothetical protein